jgi:hypothetical protein
VAILCVENLVAKSIWTVLFPGPKVVSVQPPTLLTEGGRVTIRGTNLEHTMCSIRAAKGRELLPTVTAEKNDPTVLEVLIGLGVGKGYRLELRNRTGSTFVPFKFEGNGRAFS